MNGEAITTIHAYSILVACMCLNVCRSLAFVLYCIVLSSLVSSVFVVGIVSAFWYCIGADRSAV